ncbi:MAG: ATP-binding protein [Rhodomicrobiaceae bacterium]
MNTLRAKITTLVVTAVLIVIGLAVSLFLATVPMAPPSFERLVDIDSYHLSVILKSGSGSSYQEVAETPFSGAVGRFGVKPEPAGGEIEEGMTRHLRSALRQHGLSAPVVVTRTAENYWPVVSIPLPDADWLVIPISLPPPPGEVLPFLIGGIILIVAGTAIVAIAVVHRLMRPFALIEKSLANIDPNGDLPVLTEKGPADIRATARAINLLSSRLKCAMESRMRLVAAAGHDFRTPMTRMRLRAEFLDEPERKKFLADIEELDHIADSAIRLVHEESQGGEGEAVRLDSLVRDVAAELQELQLDVRMEAAEPAHVMVKPLSLKRAIRNLLINAATHGGGATVRFQRKCASVMIEIVDDGPGIPEKLLARAFEPFFRVDAARSSTAGAGLGLAIAKEIIQRNRGTVILANRANGGLIQTIEIPAALNGEKTAGRDGKMIAAELKEAAKKEDKMLPDRIF